jgi:hypothetical protein
MARATVERIAVLIANSLSFQHTQRGVKRPAVTRTVEQIAGLLAKLPDGNAFRTIPLIDSKPDVVRRAVDKAAQSCAHSRALLLLYYFGHGLRLRDDEGEDFLAFLHPTKGSASSYLQLPKLLYTIKAHSPRKVLCILDCCYAGLAAKKFQLPGDVDFCMMACTTASTRARWEENVDHPIGVFTRVLMDGLVRGTESPTSDLITADSLFRFASKQTRSLTSDLQQPYMTGKLEEAISKYSAEPVIVTGVSEAPETSAYSKLLAIATVIGKRRFGDLQKLYRAVTHRYRESFLTPIRRDDGSIVKQLAKSTVLRRYISFFRSIGVIDEDDLMLTASGLRLIEKTSQSYNETLLDLIDGYLGRAGVPRNQIREAMQDILNRRSLPTRNNVLSDLSSTKGYSLNLRNLAIVLDLLGYIGVIGMPKPREQVYFPWTQQDRVGRAPRARTATS